MMSLLKESYGSVIEELDKLKQDVASYEARNAYLQNRLSTAESKLTDVLVLNNQLRAKLAEQSSPNKADES